MDKSGDNVSVEATTEELYLQYLKGKSIEQLSKETGMGKWALYKAFQRLKSSHEKQEKEVIQISEEKENIEASPQKSSGIKQFFKALGVIGTMFAIYFIYIQIKNNRNVTQ